MLHWSDHTHIVVTKSFIRHMNTQTQVENSTHTNLFTASPALCHYHYEPQILWWFSTTGIGHTWKKWQRSCLSSNLLQR